MTAIKLNGIMINCGWNCLYLESRDKVSEQLPSGLDQFQTPDPKRVSKVVEIVCVYMYQLNILVFICLKNITINMKFYNCLLLEFGNGNGRLTGGG